MEVLFLSENIKKKLSFVNHAISAKSQLPILSNFLLKSQKGKLYICATDLEIGIEESMPANVGEEGEITVPARSFSEFISGIQEEKIKLYTKEKKLFLETEKTKAVFQTMLSEDFPKLYEDKGVKLGSIKKEEAVENIKKVVFAASQESERPALSGVLFKKEKKGYFSLVATDGYRLSLKRSFSFVQEKERAEGGDFLIPVRLIRELLSLRNGSEINIYSSEKNNQIIFFQEETILVGRLIEAEFPNYEKIIPVDFSSRAMMDREEFQYAVKASSVFARETTNIIKLSLEKNKVVVSASAPSVGESAVDIEAKTEGEENEIAFNARYLLEFLTNVDSEKIIFEMTGPLNPGVFKLGDDKDFLHIIMPIRIQG